MTITAIQERIKDLKSRIRDLEKQVSAAMELVGMIEEDGILADDRATELVRIILTDPSWGAEPRFTWLKARFNKGDIVMTVDGKAGTVSGLKPIHVGNDIFVGAIVTFSNGKTKHFKFSELIALPDAAPRPYPRSTGAGGAL